MTTHHPHSPSQLARQAACPGSFALSAQAGPADTVDQTDYASEGDLLHARVVTGVTNDLTAEQAELVEQCIKTRDILTAGAEVQHELDLTLRDGDNTILTAGRADVVAVWRNENGVPVKAMVIDWKFGRVLVRESADNLQLAAYSAMVAQATGAPTVEAVVFQPRVSRDFEVYPFTKFAEITKVIAAVIAKANAPGMVLQAGDHCRYCPAMALCPEQRRQSTAITVLPPPAAGEVVDPQRLADRLTLARRVKRFCETIEGAAKAYLAQGGTIPGYRLTEKSSRRQITNAQEAFNAVADTITHDEFLALCAPSVAALEDRYARALKARGMTLKDAKKAFAAALGGIITTAGGYQVLERDGDTTSED